MRRGDCGYGNNRTSKVEKRVLQHVLLRSHCAGIALVRKCLSAQIAGVVHVIVVEQDAPALLGATGANRRVEGQLHDRVGHLALGVVRIQRQPGLCRVHHADLVQPQRIDLNLPKRSTGADRFHPVRQCRSTIEAQVDRGHPGVWSRSRLVDVPVHGCFRSLRGILRRDIQAVVQPHVTEVRGEQAAARVDPLGHHCQIRRGLLIFRSLAGQHRHVVVVEIRARRATGRVAGKELRLVRRAAVELRARCAAAAAYARTEEEVDASVEASAVRVCKFGIGKACLAQHALQCVHIASDHGDLGDIARVLIGSQSGEFARDRSVRAACDGGDNALNSPLAGLNHDRNVRAGWNIVQGKGAIIIRIRICDRITLGLVAGRHTDDSGGQCVRISAGNVNKRVRQRIDAVGHVDRAADAGRAAAGTRCHGIAIARKGSTQNHAGFARSAPRRPFQADRSTGCNAIKRDRNQRRPGRARAPGTIVLYGCAAIGCAHRPKWPADRTAAASRATLATDRCICGNCSSQLEAQGCTSCIVRHDQCGRAVQGLRIGFYPLLHGRSAECRVIAGTGPAPTEVSIETCLAQQAAIALA